jgi:hypothetical protein
MKATAFELASHSSKNATIPRVTYAVAPSNSRAANAFASSEAATGATAGLP